MAERPNDAGKLFVVEFDHRADDGDRLVGPFATREQAWAWLSLQTFDSEANVAPMAMPGANRNG